MSNHNDKPGTKPKADSAVDSDLALQQILLHVGQLNYTWTNTESLLIHFIAGLAGVTKDVAVVIFLTLNTTRARVDLVNRLAKMPQTPADQHTEVLALTSALVREGALRNKYNHCIYSFDPDDGKVQTILMRIQDRKHDIRMGKKQAVDTQETESIQQCIGRLQDLNRRFWAFIQKHSYPV